MCTRARTHTHTHTHKHARTHAQVISDTLNLVTPYDWLASTHLESMPKDLLNANKLSRYAALLCAHAS